MNYLQRGCRMKLAKEGKLWLSVWNPFLPMVSPHAQWLPVDISIIVPRVIPMHYWVTNTIAPLTSSSAYHCFSESHLTFKSGSFSLCTLLTGYLLPFAPTSSLRRKMSFLPWPFLWLNSLLVTNVLALWLFLAGVTAHCSFPSIFKIPSHPTCTEQPSMDKDSEWNLEAAFPTHT